MNVKRLGCMDGGPPEHTGEERLSRIYDAVGAVRAVTGKEGADAFFATLSREERMDYTYSSWKYIPLRTVRISR